MTTDTEALRAQFEQYVNPDGDVNLHWQEAGYYAGSGMQESWLDFQAGYQAGHADAKAETAWIPIAVLPAPCLKVIATYVNSLGNRRTIMAKWVPGKTEEAHSLDDEFGEYDEATDATYAPEGWYEVINNLDDCTFVAVSEGVITHWMPLPEAPDAIRAGAKETSDG